MLYESTEVIGVALVLRVVIVRLFGGTVHEALTDSEPFRQSSCCLHSPQD